MKNNFSRIERLEKAIQKILNPEVNGVETIVVDKTAGETEEQKISEREKELGVKLKRSKIILVRIDDYTGT